MFCLQGNMCLICFFFFFSSRRRHTRLQGDWSSDVCSSDLFAARVERARPGAHPGAAAFHGVPDADDAGEHGRSEEHTSELQSPCNLVCRLLLEKKKVVLYIGLTSQLRKRMNEHIAHPHTTSGTN